MMCSSLTVSDGISNCSAPWDFIQLWRLDIFISHRHDIYPCVCAYVSKLWRQDENVMTSCVFMFVVHNIFCSADNVQLE